MHRSISKQIFRIYSNLNHISKPQFHTKRSSTMSVNVLIEKNRKNAELFSSLKNELSAIQKELIAKKSAEIKAENLRLRAQVEKAKAQLIALEKQNGKKQIPVPGCAATTTTREFSTTSGAETPKEEDSKSERKVDKEKKPKKEKPAAPQNAAPSLEAPIDVGRLDLRVGKIVEVVRHPDAESLYLEKIDCGEPQPRTVVSGLVKFVPLEEMQNRMVVVLCNLKPAKMRGIVSEAMVMCASTPEKVEVLSPPAGAVPGDLVHCEGYERKPDAQMNPKKKIFETCAPDLKTNDALFACYKGSPLHVPGKGNVVAQTLKNVLVK